LGFFGSKPRFIRFLPLGFADTRRVLEDVLGRTPADVDGLFSKGAVE
jgi:hypothetical protein